MILNQCQNRTPTVLFSAILLKSPARSERMFSCGLSPSSLPPLLLPSLKPSPLPKPYLPIPPTTLRFSIAASSAPPQPPTPAAGGSPPVVRKRRRYRKAYPGESEGIVEEMRFVAMKLRHSKASADDQDKEAEGDKNNSWRPSVEGFLKYLVDSRLVFETLERTVDESSDVAYAYFRKTGLERADCLSKDIDSFKQQGFEIPEPSNPGLTYATYLDELADKSAPSFLCHLYNIYFAHMSGGEGIGKQVCRQLLEGRELEFYKWEGDVSELMKDVREKLNKLGEHWSRDEKNRCLREAAKSFRFSGQIIRLIILL